MLFGRKKKVLAGLDIGSSSLKLIELGHYGSKYTLEAFANIPFPEDTIVEREIKEIEAFSSVVAQVFSQSRTKAQTLALAMPSTFVISKIINIDAAFTDSNEIESQIQLDANRFIPYPLDEVCLDYVVLGASQKIADKIDILVVASRKDQVDARVDAVQEEGLPVKVVDIEHYALERAVPLILPADESDEQKNIAIINIGATVMSLTIIHDNSIIYTREEVFGGKQLTDSIKHRFEMNYDQAETAKRNGGLPEEYGPEILEPFKDSLVVQAAHSLQFYESTNTEFPNIDQIILSGGVAAIPGLDQMLAERSNIPTIVANPFHNMNISTKIDMQQLSKEAPSLVIACGLALRSFDE